MAQLVVIGGAAISAAKVAALYRNTRSGDAVIAERNEFYAPSRLRGKGITAPCRIQVERSPKPTHKDIPPSGMTERPLCGAPDADAEYVPKVRLLGFNQNGARNRHLRRNAQ